jgi:hypothetical protein
MSIGYRVLMGAGVENDCPVRTAFSIRAYPTLVLLDESGNVLWRSEGLVDPSNTTDPTRKLRELESIIHQQLGIR